MYELIAISVVIIVSIFNFVFTYAVAKVVLKHDQRISVLIKKVSLLIKGYSTNWASFKFKHNYW